MKIVGIDPGVEPCLCLLDTKGKASFTWFDETSIKVKRNRAMRREPAAAIIAAKLREWGADIAIVEASTPRPTRDGRKQGMGSNAQFMRARGIIEGILAGIEMPMELVPPQRWQKAMKVRGGPEGIRLKTLELYPGLADALGRKKDHNRAAALMLAVYGERAVVPNHPLL